MKPSPPARPRTASVTGFFERLARAGDASVGARLMLASGVAWAAFCVVLSRAGHAPSRVLVPVPRENYYLAQAVFVVPLLFASWLVCSLVASRVAQKLGGSGSFAAALNTLGAALSLPLFSLFLLPDVITYACFGFASLGPVLRVTAPLSFVVTLALAARAMRASFALPRGRAWLAGTAGVLAQALLSSLLLR